MQPLPNRPLPKNFIAIPEHAKKVFAGMIHDTYQWEQELFDGKTATFEMIQRADTIIAFIVQDGMLLSKKEHQPHGNTKFGPITGRVEREERVLDAMLREVKEESGLSNFEQIFYIESVQVAPKIDWLNHFFVCKDPTKEQDQALDSGEKISFEKQNFKDYYHKVLEAETESFPTVRKILLQMGVESCDFFENIEKYGKQIARNKQK